MNRKRFLKLLTFGAPVIPLVTTKAPNVTESTNLSKSILEVSKALNISFKDLTEKILKAQKHIKKFSNTIDPISLND